MPTATIVSYADIALLKQRAVDIVFRKHHRRHSDFRPGKRLGKYDHLITWNKPKQRPSWMDEKTFADMPEELTLRELKYTIIEKGKRPEKIILITTLLDAEVFTQQELADLYNIRWRTEIDLRSLKSVMEMDVLRCRTPEMVRKEIWAHLLAFNLIRTVIAKAAEAHDRQPYQISFKGALQTINAFRDYMLMDLTSDWYEELLKAIAYHEVGNRPGRYEPRAKKTPGETVQALTNPQKRSPKAKTWKNLRLKYVPFRPDPFSVPPFSVPRRDQ